MIIYDLSLSKSEQIYQGTNILYTYFREHICYTPLWSYITWTSQKKANLPGSEYTLHICVYILFEYLKIKSKLLRSQATINPCDHTWLEHLKKVSKSLREQTYKTHLCPYLVRISQNRKQIAREQNHYKPLWSYMTRASQKSEQISQGANIQNTSVSISCLNISK